MSATRYTLQVQLPSIGWVVAIKTSDLFYMARKKARLIKQGHEVKLTKKRGNQWRDLQKDLMMLFIFGKTI